MIERSYEETCARLGLRRRCCFVGLHFPGDEDAARRETAREEAAKRERRESYRNPRKRGVATHVVLGSSPLACCTKQRRRTSRRARGVSCEISVSWRRRDTSKILNFQKHRLFSAACCIPIKGPAGGEKKEKSWKKMKIRFYK